MIDGILTEAGVNHAQARFIRRPEGTYAVYFDSVEIETPDRESVVPGQRPPCICRHTGSIEVYEPIADTATEAAIESAILARGLAYSKEDRYWLSDLQAYQVIYGLEWLDKK